MNEMTKLDAVIEMGLEKGLRIGRKWATNLIWAYGKHPFLPSTDFRDGAKKLLESNERLVNEVYSDDIESVWSESGYIHTDIETYEFGLISHKENPELSQAYKDALRWGFSFFLRFITDCDTEETGVMDDSFLVRGWRFVTGETNGFPPERFMERCRRTRDVIRLGHIRTCFKSIDRDDDQ